MLKITSTAICGSDLHLYLNAMPGRPPFTSSAAGQCASGLVMQDGPARFRPVMQDLSGPVRFRIGHARCQERQQLGSWHGRHEGG